MSPFSLPFHLSAWGKEPEEIQEPTGSVGQCQNSSQYFRIGRVRVSHIGFKKKGLFFTIFGMRYTFFFVFLRCSAGGRTEVVVAKKMKICSQQLSSVLQ